MVSANIEIINDLNEFFQNTMSDKETKMRYVNKATDFTRKRSLSFSRMVALHINLLKRSLSVELESFFSHISSATVTKSAFCQQRRKLKPVFFQDWNDILISSYYRNTRRQERRWRGFRIFAIDGTKLSLPNTRALRQHFGYSTNQHGIKSATARASVLYDVLNKLVVNSKLCSLKEAERTTACDLIPFLNKDDLLLLDRGYPSFMLFYLLINRQDSHFVMRAQANFCKVVDEFRSSGKKEEIVTLRATYKAIKGLKDQGVELPPETEVKVRLARIRLDDGQDEILITNLYDTKAYTLPVLKELYFLRWPVETTYGYLKNELQVECFSGISPVSIEQDFYANIFVFNLQAVIEESCEEYVRTVNRQRTIKYKINKNVCWALMKGRVIDLFLHAEQAGYLLKELTSLFERYLEPVRPGRKYTRTKKSIKLLGKYVTLTNYKRAV